MKGIGRILSLALAMALVGLGGMKVTAHAQGSGPQTPTPTRVIIIILPSPTATTGSIGIKPTNTPTGSSVQPPTATPTQPVIAIATTAVPSATATPTRPSPTPSATTGITLTDTREPTPTSTVAVLPAGGVEIQGDNNIPSPEDQAPEPPPGGSRLRFLAMLGFGLAGAFGVGLLGFGLLRARQAGPGRALPNPVLDDRVYRGLEDEPQGGVLEEIEVEKQLDVTSVPLMQPEIDDEVLVGWEQPDVTPGIRGYDRIHALQRGSGGHSGWIELQSVNQGRSGSAAPKLVQYFSAGNHPPAPGSSGIHFSYDSLGNRTGTSAQQNETAFEFIHQHAEHRPREYGQTDYTFEKPDSDAGGEVQGWDLKSVPPMKGPGDPIGAYNFRVEVEGVGGAGSSLGPDYSMFKPDGTPVRAQGSFHSGGMNVMVGDGSVQHSGFDGLVSPNGDMLALKDGLASHSGMSAAQVDTFYQAIGERIKASLPAGLRWAQILWRLVPV